MDIHTDAPRVRDAAHVFFDVDGTLARSKMPIEPAHAELLWRLSCARDVILVSGSSEENIHARLPDFLREDVYILAQNGSAASAFGERLWSDRLLPSQKQAINAFLMCVTQHTWVPVRDREDLYEDRGSQISYSFVGHHAPIEEKEAFDPTFAVRRKVLADLASQVERLRIDAAIEVTIGGTTTLDFYQRGKNKGYNIRRLCALEGWPLSACIYIGDALFPGGNDHTVVGIVPVTIQVRNHHDTYALLGAALS